jgi:hypothetical protein
LRKFILRVLAVVKQTAVAASTTREAGQVS